MKKFLVLSILFLAATAVACSALSPGAPLPTATPRVLETLRFSLNGPPDVLDVPRLMAIDTLKAQGYTVEQTQFADQNTIVAALLKGDIEFGSGDTALAWAAIAKGGDLTTFVGKTNTTTYLVVNNKIQSCQDLNGRPTTLGSSVVISVMFQKYLATNCPNVTPQMVTISGSSNRLPALIAGSLDAARLEIVDWLNLQDKAPDKFHVLIDFRQAYPQVRFSAFSVQKTWAQQHPVAVHDFIRALLLAQRDIIANPQLLRDGIVKYLGMDSARAQKLADAYLALNVWDANGGLSQGDVQYMLDFMTSGNALPAGLTPDKVADLSYLNKVLDEIGRK